MSSSLQLPVIQTTPFTACIEIGLEDPKGVLMSECNPVVQPLE